MPSYFVDTSALAKRYHQESGSDYVDRTLDDRGSRSLISHLSIVELESVFSIKRRTGEIDEKSLGIARRRFRADLAANRLIVAPSVHPVHFQSARRLLVQFGVVEGLRTLDALQLAVALNLRDCGEITALMAADQKLCRITLLAGCPAINPERPEPVEE